MKTGTVFSDSVFRSHCFIKKHNFWKTYIIRHHDSEQCFVGGVDSHIERGGLQQDEQGVHDDVGDSEQKMWNDADMFTFS